MLRLLICIELMLLLGPAIATLLYAWLFTAPVLISIFFGNRLVTTNEFALLTIVLAGSWGMVSLSNLFMCWLFQQPWSGAKVQWFGLMLGVLASAVGCFLSYQSWMVLVFILPIAALAHLLFLLSKIKIPSILMDGS